MHALAFITNNDLQRKTASTEYRIKNSRSIQIYNDLYILFIHFFALANQNLFRITQYFCVAHLHIDGKSGYKKIKMYEYIVKNIYKIPDWMDSIAGMA
jgi:hypothetical protein